jgi:two-component system sensor histidine kinase PilS (NtrC family)
LINPYALLRWVFLARIAVAAGIFLAILIVWQNAAPADTLIATLLFIMAAVVTGVGVWHALVREAPLGRNFLYTQVLFDVAMVTGIVHITGGPDSSFAPLFILVIAIGSVLLPIPGGILVGALVGILYFADILWWYTAAPPPGVLLQIALFTVMALATGVLGDRLRRAGKMLSLVRSELQQLRMETDEILREVDTGVVTVDDAGRLAYANPAAEAMLGFRAGEWIDEPILDVLDARVDGLGATMRRSARRGSPVRWFEARSTGPGEQDEKWVGVRTTTSERAGGAWVTAVMQDVTDGKRAESLHVRAERLAAVAALSASMAHEIKNPLASIRSAVEQLTSNGLDAEDRGTLRTLVLEESDRLSRLLSQFIEYSRVEIRERGEVDLARVCADAIELCAGHPAAEGVEQELAIEHARLPVSGDGDLLHRAVFNLILNACQYAGPGGRVKVAARHADQADIPPGFDLDDAVHVRVEDSGPGISHDELHRVFDPFYTRRRGGSGLGLALVWRAVEAHDGVIVVGRSELGGAVFSVFLPTLNGSEA